MLANQKAGARSIGRGSIGFSLVMALLACAGCARRNEGAGNNSAQSHPDAAAHRATIKAAKGPASTALTPNVASGDAASSRQDVVDGLLDSEGRQSLSVDFQGNGSTNIVFYGRFAMNVPTSSRDYVISNMPFYDEPIQPMAKGDYGIVIIPSKIADKPILLNTFEAPEFKVVSKADELSYCWKPRGKESAIFIGNEDGGGILHFRNGWKWAICGD